MFVLHTLTGHPVYREWAWQMFDAIDRNCKAKYVVVDVALIHRQ